MSTNIYFKEKDKGLRIFESADNLTQQEALQVILYQGLEVVDNRLFVTYTGEQQ